MNPLSVKMPGKIPVTGTPDNGDVFYTLFTENGHFNCNFLGNSTTN
jgi:hypothetical protein